MKQLQKILLALFVWGVTAIGNSFAQSSADTTESNFITPRVHTILIRIWW